ncbi:MAG: OmpA family protein [Candidatus Marinimicrobia bacterium]|nr:OmpA family protein [Candidatus Neomarinimicrobiota bacterium]
MKRILIISLLVILTISGLMALVSNDKYDAVVSKLNKERKKNAKLVQELESNEKQNDKLINTYQDTISILKKEMYISYQNYIEASKENEQLKDRVKKLGGKVGDLSESKSNLAERMGKLEEEKAKLEKQKRVLLADRKNIKKEMENLNEEKATLNEEKLQLSDQIKELKKLKEAAEKRSAEFKKVMAKLQNMIDAGTLSVVMRDGRMIVSLSSDILFPPGKTYLSTAGKVALANLARTLRTLGDRNFLVVGHSDNDKINTKRYPSNWELSSQRAIEVVKLLETNGVNPAMLTAGGASMFDPLVANDTKYHKAQNRRVEIVFMPNMEEIPGFGPDEQGK